MSPGASVHSRNGSDTSGTVKLQDDKEFTTLLSRLRDHRNPTNWILCDISDEGVLSVLTKGEKV